jgi:hypothetical protein
MHAHVEYWYEPRSETSYDNLSDTFFALDRQTSHVRPVVMGIGDRLTNGRNDNFQPTYPTTTFLVSLHS